MQEQILENPLEQVFLYDEQIASISEKIAALKAELKHLEKMRGECLDYAVHNQIVRRGGYRLNIIEKQGRRTVNMDKVRRRLTPEEFSTIARVSVTIGDLERLLGKDEVDELCDPGKVTVEYRVTKE